MAKNQLKKHHHAWEWSTDLLGWTCSCGIGTLNKRDTKPTPTLFRDLEEYFRLNGFTDLGGGNAN